ncbi:hypothetical protein CK203_067873 [Vitis vinifera]|uniref:Uncharacterized protein n=1 Tax=Vitis vinifera TaxID=29760 RepID=A0A438BZA8_VITVI|nr:hypothetical protein CK203_067873 [Vitis vinifera]
MPPLTPLSISYEKLLPMIQDLSDFKWPRPIGTDPSTRDRSRRCAFHKDHGHTTETCRSFQYLVERLIKAGHLKQYLRSDNGRRDTQHHNPGTLGPSCPQGRYKLYYGGPSDEEYDSRRKRQKLWNNHFSTSGSHPDTATASRRPHLVPGNWGLRCAAYLVDPGSSADLVQASVMATWDTLSQASKTLDESYPDSTVFNYILGRHCTAGPSRPSHSQRTVFSSTGAVTLQCHFGRTWLHYMKAIPSTYHQMVSFLTNDGQIDLYGSQLAARQCYQIAREAGANQEDASPPEPSIAHDQ